MASTYKTPGVYVEEISKFPPSVAPVATAIPAFIGYTEKAEKRGQPISMVPTRIGSLLDFETFFGGAAAPKSLTVTLNGDNSVKKVDIAPDYYLYDSLRLYFGNGGGDCYVVSVGTYEDDIEMQPFLDGINKLKKEDEPTILLFPDAVVLTDVALGTIQKTALEQCKTLKDRVAVLDVRQSDTPADDDIRDIAKAFRGQIGVKALDYGAAYTPYLRTNLPFNYSYEDIVIEKNGSQISLASISADTSIIEQLDKIIADINDAIEPLIETPNTLFPAPFDAAPYEVPISEGYGEILNHENPASGYGSAEEELELRIRYMSSMLEQFIALNGSLTDADAGDIIEEDTLKELHDDLIAVTDNTGAPPYSFSPLEQCIRTLKAYDAGYSNDGGTTTAALGEFSDGDFPGYDLDLSHGDPIDTDIYGSPSPASDAEAVTAARAAYQALYEKILSIITDFHAEAQARRESLEALLEDTNPVYATILTAIDAEGLILPPSAAVAGVYAAVDRDRGVFKAPANVSLNFVIAPVLKIDSKDQEDLNVDPNAGKSINAIRTFTGKGTLIWGARTLAGNSNEWRYISVRRFFAFAEESIKKATEPFVFEPNDANTWVKVKSMIENFLILQWRAGALAGAKPEEAFYVKVGLGETMTSIDILEGRMIVEIGMAVVRPAEFIILRFSHKMQES